MILPDVNLLVYAFRADSPRHGVFSEWLDCVVNGDEPYGMAELVLSGFVRVVTNPRIYTYPTKPSEALAFAEKLIAPEGFVG